MSFTVFCRRVLSTTRVWYVKLCVYVGGGGGGGGVVHRCVCRAEEVSNWHVVTVWVATGEGGGCLLVEQVFFTVFCRRVLSTTRVWYVKLCVYVGGGRRQEGRGDQQLPCADRLGGTR